MEDNKLKDLVYNYKTKYEEGLTPSEIYYLMCQIGRPIDFDKYNDAMMGNTCMIRDGETINYHCDVLTGLSCGLESRDITLAEWD